MRIAPAAVFLALAGATPSPRPTSRPCRAEPPPPVVLGNDWRFQATIYGWATALNGDVGIRNLPAADVDLSF